MLILVLDQSCGMGLPFILKLKVYISKFVCHNLKSLNVMFLAYHSLLKINHQGSYILRCYSPNQNVPIQINWVDVVKKIDRTTLEDKMIERIGVH